MRRLAPAGASRRVLSCQFAQALRKASTKKAAQKGRNCTAAQNRPPPPAGIATIWAGRLDDRFGPRNVIMASLIILVVAGLLVFFLHTAGTVAFWILGLLLSACVGPAQSAARSFLARLIPEGQEGEIFGLYATTGRAVSFMAPMMYGVFIYLGTRVVGPGANYWGILGIVTVLATGLLLMLRVGDPVSDEEVSAG